MRDEDDFKDDFRLRICTLKEGRSYTFCCVALFLCVDESIFLHSAAKSPIALARGERNEVKTKPSRKGLRPSNV